MPSVSVVLSTRNRAARLRVALGCYRAWSGDTDWELIVVDNGSTDDTAQILADFAAASGLPVRLVHESRAGLARARNRGLAAARGEIVAFIDDDCYPAADYLATLRGIFATTGCDYAGGRVLLYDPSDAQVVVQTHATAYTLEPGAWLTSGQILGANMAIRRSGLCSLRGFDERLGAGTLFRSGEDTDMLRRAALAGMCGHYEPALLVHHHHGRKLADAAALRRATQRGLGACMAKFVALPATRRAYARRWFWALRRAPSLNALRQLAWGLLFVALQGFSLRRLWQHPAAALDGMAAVAVFTPESPRS